MTRCQWDLYFARIGTSNTGVGRNLFPRRMSVLEANLPLNDRLGPAKGQYSMVPEVC